MEWFLSTEDWYKLVFNEGYAAGRVAFALIIFAMLTEVIAYRIQKKAYPWEEAGVSVALMSGHLLAGAAVHGIVFGIIAFGVYHYRLFTLTVDMNHWYMGVLLFVLCDFAYYVMHRASHSVNFLWGSHAVHHSAQRMIVLASIRLTWTPLISGVFLFYLPLVWLGFTPQWVYGMVSASLAYQFSVHTELVPRLGWLEYIIDTPSNHRVHHGTNDIYINKNFGGILMIWDHIFGTYQAELADNKAQFGLIPALPRPSNVFDIAFGQYRKIAKGLINAPSWKARLNVFFGPPQ
ncbi:sterol desaturase family protein [Polynucleobacter sp. 15G-AUS-farblos]|uniref:sterol desaturase family protein n=1 Tax=Polynucleobacter sp. 15G-AUS-farblos TaxID=2689094 RepID=UPI001C0E4EA1|nr:sterol desaturase family protein [Polynucleobacter sp. 15G-AUS-farblos]MBU3584258.1 sterol desaturase family protein [Polynucleobacter sp. 15G-AUS-farblos]